MNWKFLLKLDNGDNVILTEQIYTGQHKHIHKYCYKIVNQQGDIVGFIQYHEAIESKVLLSEHTITTRHALCQYDAHWHPVLNETW